MDNLNGGGMGNMSNIWAVLVTAVIFYGIGAIWYSPMLFGKLWMAESGISEEKRSKMDKGHTIGIFVATFFLSLIMAFISSQLVSLTNSNSISSGCLLGLLLWIGFIAVSMGINNLYEDKSFKFYLINAGYFLLGLLEMNVILSIWK